MVTKKAKAMLFTSLIRFYAQSENMAKFRHEMIGKTRLCIKSIVAMVLPLAVMEFVQAEQVNNTATKDQIQRDVNKTAHQKLTANMQDKSFRDNIPLVMSYLDVDGKVVTIVDKDGEESKEVYEEHIKEFVGRDVDMKINTGYFEREACDSRDSNCNPLYGGIKIQVVGEQKSTLTIGATNNDGVQGFVVSSHAVGSGTTQDVLQPGGHRNKIGDVITNPDLDGRSSDVAFVDLSGRERTTNEIFRTSTTHYAVTGTADPDLHTRVQKTGYYGGERDGYVIGTSLTVYDPTWGQLTDQYAANYHSMDGDSGAPVYSYRTTPGNVTLYGIHVGYGCMLDANPCPTEWRLKVFSPWSNVESELGLDTIP